MHARAKHPFQFVARMNLIELTGLKARSVPELAQVLKTVPASVIYHHTHHFLKQHHFLSPEPPNDFAYWVSTALNEDRLGEQLASIDTIQFTSLYALRDRLVQVLDRFLTTPRPPRVALEEEEFHFMKSISLILPTPYHVFDLPEFVEALEKVSVESLYHHIFEARLRLEKGSNDFSIWLDKELGENELAQSIARLDPYTQSLDTLRHQVIRLVNTRIGPARTAEVAHAAR